jgi:hypothetical protein
VSAPAPPTAASPYRCPACAGQGIWHAGRQIVVCRSCGTAIETPPVPPGPVEAFEFLPLLRDRPDSGRDWQPGATRVRCTTCGTSMEYPAYLAGRDCDGCGSPALVACDATGAPLHPSGIVPFALTESEALDRVAAWYDKRRPIGSPRRMRTETVRGVYVPGWTFSARVRVPWRAERVKTNRDGETEREPISGVADVAITDHYVPAAGSVPADLLASVQPFAASDLVPYDPRYLAGYDVEVYAVNLWDAWDAADAYMRDRVDRAVRADTGRDATGVETWPEWSGQRCRHVLVPVYAVEYAFAGQRFTTVVNGRDGKVHGRFPKDPIGIALTLAVLVGLVAGLVWLVIAAVRWLF